MKNIKNLSILLFAILCVGFVSCKDDDDVSKDNLVGTWQSTWNKGYKKFADHPEWNDEWDGADTEVVVTFNSDQTGTDGDDSFNWSLDGNQLTISDKKESKTVKVLNLSSSELIIENFEKGTDEDGPYEYYDIITFKKK